MTLIAIQRSPWRTSFPEVVVHTSEARRDAHSDYDAAKAGDPLAAVRLACALLSNSAVVNIRELIAGRQPALVPVRAVETDGINLIPDAMAHELGHRLGLAVAVDIVQINTVGHTRARGFHRLAFQPAFDGPVEPERAYVLVDDHVGLGATLANLRGHIETAGGSVLLATTLSASRNSHVLALCAETRQNLREKHGDALERYWQAEFAFGLDRLTEPEAGYLLRQPSFDVIRDRMAKARRSGVPGRVR